MRPSAATCRCCGNLGRRPAGFIPFVGGYCVALPLSDEARGEEFAEFLDKFIESLGVVVVCS